MKFVSLHHGTLANNFEIGISLNRRCGKLGELVHHTAAQSGAYVCRGTLFYKPCEISPQPMSCKYTGTRLSILMEALPISIQDMHL